MISPGLQSDDDARRAAGSAPDVCSDADWGRKGGREGDIIMELRSSPAQHRTDVCKFNKLYHPARRPGNGSRLLLRGDSDGTSRNFKCDIVVMVVMVVSRLLPRQFGLKIFLFCISQIFLESF